MNTMTKQKILYIITKGNFGGAQRYVYDLARYMHSEYEIVVATGTPGKLDQKLSSLGIKTLNIKNLKRDPSIRNDFASIIEIKKIIEDEKPHIVHLNSSKAGFNGALASGLYNLFSKKESRTKVVFTAHGWAFTESRNAVSKLAFYIIHSLTVFLSDTTIAVSKMTKRNLSILPSIASKMVVIHNGIGEETYQTKLKSRNVLAPHSHHKVWIGTLSELHKNKGLDIAIEGLEPILKNHPEIGFYIAGQGEEEASLKKLVAEKGLESSVIFLGYVDNAKQYLKAFNIYLQSSRTENLPYVLLEAGLAGLPVIATDVGGVGEVIDNLKSGMLIRKQSPKDIGNAVTYALEHRTESNVFGKNLKETIKTHFLIKHMIAKTRKLYIQLEY